MSPFNLETCARPNILALEPYRCARDDYKDDGTNILLDANENAYGPAISRPNNSNNNNNDSSVTNRPSSGPSLDLTTLHRYPDPHQATLKQLLCDLRTTHAHTAKTLTPANLFVGVGSDEAIDALLRCFCVPGRDKILVCPPTYGMYSVSAQVNDVGLVKVPLLPGPGFDVDVPAVTAALSDPEKSRTIKMVYLCSPGNPTGSLLRKEDVRAVLEHPTWNGVVVVDEAYVDFAAPEASLAEWVVEWPNLVVLQTLSKAFGLAGIRLGAAFASAPIARLLNSLKAPYNVSSLTAAVAEYALSGEGLEKMRENRGKLVAQRERMIREMPKIEGVGRLRGGTYSNFLLYEMLDKDGKPDNVTALAVYERLAEFKGVVVRFRGKEHGCLGCLRITVGTEDEVTRFLASLERTLAEVRGTAPAADEDEKEAAASGVVA
ncbi:pyridoxal phosphate-dependent transferase [Chaetomium strumarium]|uniref:histidinol-phosphate transaminase n=1 Tax=Chaetomium strumarium TaxID=1170767 RepID=A0AAJ0M3F1_9PEZI|nr:pyridoxal phosphate-dependent transferase [Chaetomium strumarium]